MDEMFKFVQERVEEAIDKQKQDPEFRQRAETFIREGREVLIRLENWLGETK